MKTLHLVANSHIDPMWLWEWEDGAAAAVSTFRTAADFCEEFDGFVFNHNEALLYEWVKEYEPPLFERIKKLVKEGKWIIMGGWYLQPDVNLPYGESIVRQILTGYRFFMENFGVFPRTAMNVDSFGHSRGLVQILKKTGFENYLCCRPYAFESDVPEIFIWTGRDGSRIQVRRDTKGYNTGSDGVMARIRKYLDPKQNVQGGLDTKDSDNNAVTEDTGLLMWGIGDHGGAVSRKDLEELTAYLKSTEEKPTDIIQSSFDAYFDAIKAEGKVYPEWNKSLKYSMVGCYTSQIRIKQKHRELENLLYSTEKMVTAAYAGGLLKEYPIAEISVAVRDLLLCEFHDILPGSAIEPVEKAGLRALEHGLEIMTKLRAKSFFLLTQGQPKAVTGEYPILVYNPHPYEVDGIVECEYTLIEQNWNPDWTLAEVTGEHAGAPVQNEKETSSLNLDWQKRAVIRAKLAPSSMNRFDLKMVRVPGRPVLPKLAEGEDFVMDNGDMYVRISTKTGLIEELKVAGKEYAAGGLMRPVLVDEDGINGDDPWHMRSHVLSGKEIDFELASPEFVGKIIGSDIATPNVRIIEDGAVRTVVEAVFRCSESRVVMQYKVPKQGCFIDVACTVLWGESGSALKLALPTTINGRLEAQSVFTADTLRTDGIEEPVQKWAMLTDDSSALAVINKTIGGLSCNGGELKLTLLRSAVYSGHPIADRPVTRKDAYVGRIDNGERHYSFRIEAGAADEISKGIEREAQVFNENPFALCFFPPGTDAATKPLPMAVLSDDCIVLSAFKRAEFKDDAFIIRLYNGTDQARSTKLTMPAFGGAAMDTTLGAWEVASFIFDAGTGRFTPCNMLEKEL